MINIFIFLALMFLFTIIAGRVIEKFRVPWLFAALIFGGILSVYNPFMAITTSETFNFLAELGMYFLLFIIGFEIDLKEMKKREGFLFKSTFFVILLEALFGTILIHYVFTVDWVLSSIVALSFATVGEAVLIPILNEFKMINSKLGQSIIGIGILDDIFEVIVLVLVVAMLGSQTSSQVNIALTLGSLFVLFMLLFGLMNLKKKSDRFNFINIETLFIFTMFLLFLFLGIGEYAEAMPLAAFMAGIGIKTFITGKRLELIESEIKSLCYGFFAPIFFMWAGLSMNIGYMVAYPMLILLVIAVSGGSKILGGFIVGRNYIGKKGSLLLGLGLSVRFSTSIVVVKLFLDNGMISSELYSILMASSIIFTFIIPIIFSVALNRWGFVKKSS